MSPDDIGSVSRLYQLMQGLSTARMAGYMDEPGPHRNVVSEADAVDAVSQVAEVLDETRRTRKCDQSRLEVAGAALMVVRDFVRPLPPVDTHGSEDVVTDDLRDVVRALRESFGRLED